MVRAIGGSAGLALAALGACGGGPRPAPVTVDDDPGALQRPARPATPTAATTPTPAPAAAGGATPLVATLTTIGPLSAATDVPDGLERALPGDTLTGKFVTADGRGEPAFEVSRRGEPLLDVFYDDRRRISAVWILSPVVSTVWGVPVGSRYLDASARLAGLECTPMQLEDAGRAACSTPSMDNVVFVVEPVAARIAADGPRPTDDELRAAVARSGTLAESQLMGASVTRIIWWPAS